jgi:formate hydrogenlyase subunit 3/multisubunit Na+/H+ antiporter MnhD subunit
VLARLVLGLMSPGGALGGAGPRFRELLLLLALLSVLIMELAAFKERDLHRLLGFSSAGQMGMVALGISAGDEASLQGALLLLISHSLAKLLLFVLAGFFSRAAGSRDWTQMRGLGRRLPWAGGLFVLGALALMGMPLLAGFWGKMELLRGLAAAGGIWLAGMSGLLAGTVLEGVYFMRIAHGLFEPGREWGDLRLNAAALVPGLLLAAALLTIGFFPGLLGAWLDGAVRELRSPADPLLLHLVAAGGCGV